MDQIIEEIKSNKTTKLNLWKNSEIYQIWKEIQF